MKTQLNKLTKSQARLGGMMVGFLLGGAAILILSGVARAGYGFGQDLREKHDREAAENVRQGD